MKTEHVKILCPCCEGKGTIDETLWKPEGAKDKDGKIVYGKEQVDVICPNPECHGQGWVWAEKLL